MLRKIDELLRARASVRLDDYLVFDVFHARHAGQLKTTEVGYFLDLHVSSALFSRCLVVGALRIAVWSQHRRS